MGTLGGSFLFAQTESNVNEWPSALTPEQPEWNAPASVAPESVGVNEVPIPSETMTAEATEASSSPDLELPGEDPGPNAILDGNENATVEADLEPVPGANPADAAATVGTPQASNFYLPDFDTYGRAWFERQGLKFRVGPVHLRMTLSTGVSYNDNLFGQNTNPTGDYVAQVSPNFLVGIGDFNAKENDYFLLAYQPSLQSYYQQKQQDGVNQNLEITGQATFSRYSTKVNLGYATSNQANATQSGGLEYGTLDFAWENRYFLGAKTFAQATFGAVVQQSENENNYQTFSFSPQLGYQYSPKTTIFFGPFAGIAFIGDGGTQTFQGLSVGFEYTNLRKFRLSGNVGVQARQFEGLNATGASNFLTPVFNFSATYEAAANTSVSLSFSRDVQISDLLRGLTYTNSSLGLSLGQKIYQRLSFGIGLSYQLLEYQGDEPFGRTENFISVSPSLGYNFWRNTIGVSVYYQRQQRTSEVSQLGYTQNVYGFSLSYSF